MKTPKNLSLELLLSVANKFNYFKTKEGICLVEIPKKDYREYYPIESDQFQAILIQRIYKEFGTFCSMPKLNELISFLKMKALTSRLTRRINLRALQSKGRVTIDIGDENWHFVVIDKGAFKLSKDIDEIFIRPTGMLPLPMPLKQGEGDLYLLDNYLNLKSQEEFYLLCIAMSFAYLTQSPDLILMVTGPQGSAKTTSCNLIKRILDPTSPNLIPIPRKEQDLLISGNNMFVLACDNLSGLKPDIADALCRISTGIGFKKRKLYKDLSEVIVDIKRFIILNGIDDISNRPDIVDRALIIELQKISSKDRKTISEIYQNFEKDHPKIFTGVLELIAYGLSKYDEVRLEEMPRMANFAKWGTACESFFGLEKGGFMRIYNENIHNSNLMIASSDLLVKEIIDTLESIEENIFEGTMSKLLDVIHYPHPQKFLPQTASTLGKAMRRISPVLERIGIELRESKGPAPKCERMISLSYIDGKDSKDGNSFESTEF